MNYRRTTHGGSPQGFSVQYVGLAKVNVESGQILEEASRQVVDHSDFVDCGLVDKATTKVATDEARSTSHENSHATVLLGIIKLTSHRR
jgi:hypothetical protein